VVSAAGDSDAMREAAQEAAREVLRELLPDILRDALTPVASANGNGHHAEEAEPIPQVPAPPVAAVLRPSTWSAPAAPGEVVGDNGSYTHQISHVAAGAGEQGGRVETVAIDSDEDLNAFVRALAKRLENPRDRRAIRTGQIRFALQAGRSSPGSTAGAPGIRIEKGAVTERIVRQAASEGARLVLARGAVLTPLARDQAKALGVEIEKERTC
jgi:hypothetical protein